jgi:hypothetical protein
MPSRIAGTGSYLPAQVLTNHDLARRIDTSDAWIRARTGNAAASPIRSQQTVYDRAQVTECYHPFLGVAETLSQLTYFTTYESRF